MNSTTNKCAMLPRSIPFKEFLLQDQKCETIESGLKFFEELQKVGAWPETWPAFDQAVVDLREGIKMLATSYFKVIKEDPMDLIFSGNADEFDIVFIDSSANEFTRRMNVIREKKEQTPFFFHIQPVL